MTPSTQEGEDEMRHVHKGRRRGTAQIMQQMETMEERVSVGTEDKSYVDVRKIKKIELGRHVWKPSGFITQNKSLTIP